MPASPLPRATLVRPPHLLAALVAAWLGACAAADDTPATSGAAGDTGRARGAPDTSGPDALPPGAIEVGDGLYQVPIGRDDDGCMMYRMHSPSRMVVQAIFYRAPDGAFTMDRSEAACASGG